MKSVKDLHCDRKNDPKYIVTGVIVFSAMLRGGKLDIFLKTVDILDQESKVLNSSK
jgi:hypothetical protein